MNYICALWIFRFNSLNIYQAKDLLPLQNIDSKIVIIFAVKKHWTLLQSSKICMVKTGFVVTALHLSCLLFSVYSWNSIETIPLLRSLIFFLNLTNTFGFLNIHLKNEFLCTSMVIRCHKIGCLKVCIVWTELWRPPLNF